MCYFFSLLFSFLPITLIASIAGLLFCLTQEGIQLLTVSGEAFVCLLLSGISLIRFNLFSVVWDGMQCSVTFSVLISGILFPGTQARCNFVSVTWDGIQCHTTDAPDSGHEGGNFTATLYQELASQPGHNDY